MLFFVLSGFLVGGMSLERYLHGKFEFKKYIIDRISRIYTPFVPALVFTLGICLWTGMPFSWIEAMLNLLSLQGVFAEPLSVNMTLWSLSYEIWFYILCGSVLTVFGPYSSPMWRLSLILLAVSIFIFSKLDFAFLCAWLLGLAAYFIKTPRIGLLLAAGSIITAIGMVLMQLTSISHQVDLAQFNFINRSIAVITLSAGCALLIAGSAQQRERPPRLRWLLRVAPVLSSFSYSVYLMHIPVIYLLNEWGMLPRYDRVAFTTVGGFLANATIIMAVSYGAYWLFERQTPRVRQFLYKKLLTPKPVPVPASPVEA